MEEIVKKNLEKARRGVSLVKFTEPMTGVAHNTYHGWEKTGRPPAIGLYEVSRVTGLPMEWFFIDHDNESQAEPAPPPYGSVRVELENLDKALRSVEFARQRLERVLDKQSADIHREISPDKSSATEAARARRKRATSEKSSNIP